MASKNWDELPPDTQDRLRREGISESNWNNPDKGFSSEPPNDSSSGLFGSGSGDRNELAERYIDSMLSKFPDAQRNYLIERTQVTDPNDKLYLSDDDLIAGANATVQDATDAGHVRGRRNWHPLWYHPSED